MNNKIEHYLNTGEHASGFRAYSKIYHINHKSTVRFWLWGILLTLIVIMLLPWTQNIRAKGNVTTLRQEQRPQQVNAIIAGAIDTWYVKEGDFVKTGDTILKLSEVKTEYFDPGLLQNTREQINAKQQSIESFEGKASTGITQANALSQGRNLKLLSLDNKIAQQQLKVQIDEADLLAASNEAGAYKRQINAAAIMLDSGAISLTEFEKRKINFQNSLAKTNSASNKLLQSKQELSNLNIEKNSVVQDYTDKIAKAEGDRFSSLSSAANSQADKAKLQNQYKNYDARNKLYFITASQSGQITKAKKAGIGEVVKEGEMLVEIVPDHFQFAVEMFIEPMDLPLVSTGQKVWFAFDGFPAIVFSGWPNSSYGTFSGKVVAVENAVSENGKFRVLVTEDPAGRKWPKQLRLGGGAQGIALLKTVNIYYEIWRNINGFPPDYYSVTKKDALKTN